MARQTRAIQYRRNAYTIALIGLIALCALGLYIAGSQNTLEEVRVIRNGQQAALSYVSDEQIIRASGLKMGVKIDTVENMTEIARKGINELGYVSFVSIRRASRRAVEITVDSRMPFAILDSAGYLILIDEHGYVIAYLDELPTYETVYVTGADVTDFREGRQVVTARASQLDDILTIVNAIHASGYGSVYSELNVKDPKGMYLVTNSSLIVNFYDTTNMTKTLDLAQGVINSGVTNGKVIISGDYAGYQPAVSANKSYD